MTKVNMETLTAINPGSTSNWYRFMDFVQENGLEYIPGSRVEYGAGYSAPLPEKWSGFQSWADTSLSELRYQNSEAEVTILVNWNMTRDKHRVLAAEYRTL